MAFPSTPTGCSTAACCPTRTTIRSCDPLPVATAPWPSSWAATPRSSAGWRTCGRCSRAGCRRSPGRTAATLPWPSAAPAAVTAPSTSPSGSPRPFVCSGASWCAIAAWLAKARKRNAGLRAFPPEHGALSRRSPAVADLRAALHGNGEGLPARRHALWRMPDPRWRGSRRAGDPGGDRLPRPYRRLGHAATRHAACHRPRRAALSHPTHAKVRVVAPVGRLDHDNCEAFRNDLAPHLDACLSEGHALIFDLSRLEYVSSAGLRCLMLAARQAVSRSGRLVIASLQPLVAEIFQISRFNLVFDVFPTMREALASVSSEAVEAFERG